MSRFLSVLVFTTCFAIALSGETLRPGTSRVDNPLKGLVPYMDAEDRAFPHSLEFFYMPLSRLVDDSGNFTWNALDESIRIVSARGCQTIFRVWLETPGQPSGMPPHLRRIGVRVIDWTDPETNHVNHTPDYGDERLVAFLEKFIAAAGKRYDGRPEIGFITAGLLGCWGEWHTWPRDDLFAPVLTQRRIMDAYERAFKITPILLRYPTGEGRSDLAANHRRPFGYHDDSFAFATLDTQDAAPWFFLVAMRNAGTEATSKWKRHPIGGEIRPELWGIVFDADPAHPAAQDFDRCVRETHATWLMDSGMFNSNKNQTRIERAKRSVTLMGYDFRILSAELVPGPLTDVAKRRDIVVRLTNQGVAPFYANWNLEVGVFQGKTLKETIPVDWKLGSILPGVTTEWQMTLPVNITLEDRTICLRVVNPLRGGRSLAFANADQDTAAPGWLTLIAPVPGIATPDR